MTKPTVLHNIFLALALAVGGGFAFQMLAVVFGFNVAAHTILPAIFGVYTLVQLRASPLRNGRITAFCLWAVAALCLFWYGGGLLLTGGLHLLGLWLLRCILFRRGLFGAAADFALVATGGVVSLAAWLQTGSVGLAIWCLFLIQSLHPLLSGIGRRKKRNQTAATTPRTFEQAHASALAALQQLYRKPVNR